MIIVAAAGLCGCSHTHVVHVSAGAMSWSATFPAAVTEEVIGPDARTWAATRGKETDAVTTSLLPAGPVATRLTTRLADAVNGSASRAGGAVISHDLLRWLGHPAEDATIATTDALYRERVTVVGGELYVLAGLSRASPPVFTGYAAMLSTFQDDPAHRT